MKKSGKEERVYRFTVVRLERIFRMKNEGQRKALLAKLRRGAGRVPGELPELWGEFLIDMPEDLYGSGNPSRAEWAIYTALTLFALHQQGNEKPMHITKGNGLGASAARIALANGGGEDNLERVRRRFNIVATADDMSKLTWYLRTLIQLMSAKSVPLDYARLARDLYRYQEPRMRNRVRLEWGRDLYRTYYKATVDQNEQEERKK